MSSDNSGSSNSSSSLSGNGNNHPSGNNLNIINDEEADAIHAEDLADVDNDISLGNPTEESDDDGLSSGSLEYDTGGVSSATLPKGYIDDAIVENVMKSADDRLASQKSFPIKKMVGYVICATALFAIIIGASIAVRGSAEKKVIEKRIHDKSTAYEFEDKLTFRSSVAGTTDETTESGATDTIDQTGTSETETTDDGRGVWITPIALASPIPQQINDHLLDNPLPATPNVTPIFWQVPFGGGFFQSIMTGCHHMVLASNHKLADDDTIIEHQVNQAKYLNVDLSTLEGIASAAEQNLIGSNPDVIVSNHINTAVTQLLNPSHKGRLFTALRHPVDRIIAEYHYTVTTSNQYFVRNLGFKEFIEGSLSDKDWMTRFLIGKEGILVPEDLNLAKEILRKKCLVGLHDHLELSIYLFEVYFGWNPERGQFNQNVHEHCQDAILEIEADRAREVYYYVGNVRQESEEYRTIVSLNSYDMELYWYAYALFQEQLVFYTARR